MAARAAQRLPEHFASSRPNPAASAPPNGTQMTTVSRERLICECGQEGALKCTENDAPKPRESYSLEGFEGFTATFEPYCDDMKELLNRLQPKCPHCGRVGKVRYG